MAHTTTLQRPAISELSQGTVYRVTPTGEETILHRFLDGLTPDDGYYTLAGLYQGADGDLYGMASHGGSTYSLNGIGYGTVYKLSYTVLAPAALALSQTSVVGGQPATVTLDLNALVDKKSGFVVRLKSNRPLIVQVPSSITVPASTWSVSFGVTTATVSKRTTATITAIGGGVQKTVKITVTR